MKNMLNRTIVSITGGATGDDRICFTADDGSVFILEHVQDCCESVSIEDVTGDLSDLLNSPLLMAEEITDSSETVHESKWDDYAPESFTWTFYKFATAKGYVTIRFLGTSNGYYSEGVTYTEQLAA